MTTAVFSAFKSKKSLDSWLADYAISHQHPIKKKSIACVCRRFLPVLSAWA